MSEMNPCLPGCIKAISDHEPPKSRTDHAPGCPNSEAAKVEPRCSICGEKAGVDWKEADNWAADPLPQSTERGDVDWLPDAKVNAARAYRALRAEVDELKQIKEQHNRLCLADLGGDGVWPCGCHHLIVDSYGSRKLLTAADGEVHQECDDHSELRAELAQARDRFAHDIDSRDHAYALLEAERQRLHDSLAQAREEIAKLESKFKDQVRDFNLVCGELHKQRTAREKAEARVRELEKAVDRIIRRFGGCDP